MNKNNEKLVHKFFLKNNKNVKMYEHHPMLACKRKRRKITKVIEPVVFDKALGFEKLEKMINVDAFFEPSTLYGNTKTTDDNPFCLFFTREGTASFRPSELLMTERDVYSNYVLKSNNVHFAARERKTKQVIKHMCSKKTLKSLGIK